MHISQTAGGIFSIQSSMELSRPEVVQCHDHLSICPVRACPWAKNLSKLAPMGSSLSGTHISEFETAGQIYSIQSSMELSGPVVVVQRHGHLPIRPIWSCLWDKKLSNRVPHGSQLCGTHISGWIYTVRSSMVLYEPVVVQYHGLMAFNLDFQGQIMKNRIKGIGRLVVMERKGCRSMGSGTHFVALNFDLSHDLDLEFSRWNLKKSCI